MKVFIHGSFLLCGPKEGGFSRHKDAGICRLRAAKPHPPFSFPRKKTGGVTVQKKGVRLAVSGLNKPFASGMRMPARGGAAFSIAIRLASASIIRCRSADLVGVLTNIRLPEHSTMRRAPAMPLFRRQSAAERTSLAPHDSKARLRVVTNCRGSWRSHVHRTYTAQRVQLFKPKTGNGTFLSGDLKGDTLFREREYPPFARSPRQVGETKGVHPFCFSKALLQREFYHPP